MSRLARFDLLQAEAVRLRQIQRTLKPTDPKWLKLDMEIAGCFLLQMEA